MFRQVNSAFADKLQRRSRRRLIVIATIVSAVGIGAAIAAGGDDIVFVALATVPFWLCMVLLNFSLRGIFELDDNRLDEHQIAVRNSAYKSAYGFTLIFLVLVITVASVVDLDRIRTFATAATAFFICALAPRLITAWTAENSHDEG
jgi:FtsH-binding integral membrane protein